MAREADTLAFSQKAMLPGTGLGRAECTEKERQTITNPSFSLNISTGKQTSIRQ